MRFVHYKINNIPVPASQESVASLDQSSGDLAVPGCSGLKLAYNEKLHNRIYGQ
jgi:hypothetical protein